MANSLFTLRAARAADKNYIDTYTYAEGMDDLPNLEGVTVAVNTDDQAVGFIRIVQDSHGIAHINPVVVHTTWRGYGVGRALVEDARSRFGELRLVARGASIPFYEALGFKPCDWSLIEKDVSEDCDGCSFRDECGPLPMRLIPIENSQVEFVGAAYAALQPRDNDNANAEEREAFASPTNYSPEIGVTGRDVAAILHPCPVCIVGAHDGESGQTGFATIIWTMPVSHTPPMVAIALREQSHTMGIIHKVRRFSLATLPAGDESEALVKLCGTTTGHTTNKAACVDYALHDGVPVVTQALSWEIVEVESILPAGDHLLVVGRVVEAASKATRDAKGRLAPVETLLCVQRDAFVSL